MSPATPAASFLTNFTLASLPLLAMLAVMILAFGNEREALDFFARHRADHQFLKQAMRWITSWVHLAFYLVYAVLLLKGLMKKDTRFIRFSLVWLAAQLVVNVALVHLLKMGLGRPRPGEGMLYQPMTTDPDHHSLPSGHTSDVTTSCLPLALWMRRAALSLALGCLVCLTALSRIYLGKHYPSDVFFGWLLGAVAGSAVYLFASPTPKGDA